MKTPSVDIFWEGGDDDALRMLGKDYAKRSLLAYLLLGHSVVLHPAYVLQEEVTRDLVLRGPQSIITPPAVRLILGGSNSAEAYIADRVEKLKNVAREHMLEPTELQSYERHGDAIRRYAVMLDEQFTGNDARQPIVWSRDVEFRRLIRDDLENHGPSASNLFACAYRDSAATLIDSTGP